MNIDTLRKIRRKVDELWSPVDQKRARDEGFILISNLSYYIPELIGTFCTLGDHVPPSAQELFTKLREANPNDPFYARAVAASAYLRMIA